MQKTTKIDVHTYFGLTYSNYLILHRTILQSAPIEWQHKFTEVMGELEDMIGPGMRERLPNNMEVNFLARRPELVAPECCHCNGEGLHVDKHGDSDDCPECDGAGVDFEADREFESSEKVGFISDPIPHYNRGRTLLDLDTGEEIRYCGSCKNMHTWSKGCE